MGERHGEKSLEKVDVPVKMIPPLNGSLAVSMKKWCALFGTTVNATVACTGTTKTATMTKTIPDHPNTTVTCLRWNVGVMVPVMDHHCISFTSHCHALPEPPEMVYPRSVLSQAWHRNPHAVSSRGDLDNQLTNRLTI